MFFRVLIATISDFGGTEEGAALAIKEYIAADPEPEQQDTKVFAAYFEAASVYADPDLNGASEEKINEAVMFGAMRVAETEGVKLIGKNGMFAGFSIDVSIVNREVCPCCKAGEMAEA